MTEVDPERATAAMAELWKSYNNVVSPALLTSWSQMAKILNDAGTETHKDKWTVLAMPTGTGKSQFTAVYCAMLPNPEVNLRNIQTGSHHPGVLFVTRFVEEAESFAKQVNSMAGCTVAAAYHSGEDCEITLEQAKYYPILAITHRAFELHQTNLSTGPYEDTRWDHLTAWHLTRRAKVIVDETLNFVISAQTSASHIGLLLSAMTSLANANETLFAPLKAFQDAILISGSSRQDHNVSKPDFSILATIDLQAILKCIDDTPDGDLFLSAGLTPQEMRKLCKRTIIALNTMNKIGSAWISHSGAKILLNSASVHPSFKYGEGVILDATAPLHVGYKMLDHKLRLVSAPSSVRSYANVTLYVSSGHKVGKLEMKENALKQWPTFRREIASTIPNETRLLVCCHKDVRTQLQQKNSAPSDSLAHWYNIDGKNDWQDHEAIALFGLPYLNNIHAKNIAIAILGPQSDDWHRRPDQRRWRGYSDIVAALDTSCVCTSVVQAINRVRCRSVIDKQGNCKPTSVFLLLPASVKGDAILDAVTQQMPDLRLERWIVPGPKRKKRKGRDVDEVLAYFETALADSYRKKDIQSELKISASSMDRLASLLNDSTTDEHKMLFNLGFVYSSKSGEGGHSSFLRV